MPKTAGGIVAFVVASVIATMIGMYIITRVSVLSRVTFGAQKAA